jgi:hypothetical protein
MDTAVGRSRAGGRWRRRLGALGALVVVVFVAGSALGPGSASADSAAGGSRGDGFIGIWHDVVTYTLVSSEPTFDVADARVVDNGLDAPVSVTLTSQQSQTFTVQVTVGTERQFGDFLKANVSATVVMTRMTSIGVSITAQVPAHGRLVGRYGVEAFTVTYDTQVKRCLNDLCGNPTTQRLTTNVPTFIEGWHLASS